VVVVVVAVLAVAGPQYTLPGCIAKGGIECALGVSWNHALVDILCTSKARAVVLAACGQPRGPEVHEAQCPHARHAEFDQFPSLRHACAS
jgi:hypothetical protein